MGGQGADYAEGEDPDDLWKNLRTVLETMTTEQRRTLIDDDLVRTLDNVIETKGTRSMYGPKGRDVGEEETEDDEDGEEGEDDE